MILQNSGLKIELSKISKYKILKIIKLSEIDSIFYLLYHKKTGAKHIHLENDDTENSFGVAFKTISFDSSGIAHILEHTVLCGSYRFPVRDPFFSMIKRSLSTFMNAFTASDWTMYPFSTQNKKDFYNLMEVYLDSAFFPKIDKLSYKQEGCRIELLNTKFGTDLAYKGIVYNEMKGVISSTDQVVVRSLFDALYPDTIYSSNSGGDPAKIPTLSYEKLKSFHNKYYHPSNSFFYTYGNLPLHEHLDYIDKYFLSRFSNISVCANVPNQPRWKKIKKCVYFYPYLNKKDINKKTQVCFAWLVADIRNSYEVLILGILDQILLGNAASPLRKILIDSKLGSSLSDGTGFDSENKDTIFICGLKDVEDLNSGKVKDLILNGLEKIYRKGIDKTLINSVLHQIELYRKERTNVPYPFGIKVLIGFASYWINGGCPEKLLQIDKDLDNIKNNVLVPGFFEKKIRQYFLNNEHRVFLVLRPNQGIEEKERDRIKEELYKLKLNMTELDHSKIKMYTKKLDKNRYNKEDLSCLPTLFVKDVPRDIKKVESPFNIFDDSNIIGYNQMTSGIIYSCGLIGIGSLKNKYLSLIPFFCYVLSKLGTKLISYTDMAKKIDLYTGGINFTFHSNTLFKSHGVCLPFISFNVKCLSYNVSSMVYIIEKILRKIDFDDYDRVLQLLMEYIANINSLIVKNGHILAIKLACKNFSDTTYLNHMWSAANQLCVVKHIFDNRNKNSINKLICKFKLIFKSIFFRENVQFAFIADKNILFSKKNDLKKVDKLFSPYGKKGFKSVKFNLGNKYLYDGWITSTSVSFVAQAFETVKIDHIDSPSLSVISKIITYTFLHKEIREKGGAYGAFSIYDKENGLFSFCSYRDPNIHDTLKVYDKICYFLSSRDFSDREIEEAILQVCAEIDKPDTPSTLGKKAFFRKKINFNDEFRQIYKTRLLRLNKGTVKQVIYKYFNCKGMKKSVAVISNRNLLDLANEGLGKIKLKIENI